MQGIKYDGGKPALDLIDPEFELDVARVLTYGAKKYDIENWKKGMSLGKVMAGVRRHLNAIARGEFIDPETGLQHTAHAACGVMFLHYFIRTGALNVPDDRWAEVSPSIAEFTKSLETPPPESSITVTPDPAPMPTATHASAPTV